jgi:hypothetical protein
MKPICVIAEASKMNVVSFHPTVAAAIRDMARAITRKMR